jgi:acyl-CoA synthetase (AMP-forming)/AMP-acid ligase II
VSLGRPYHSVQGERRFRNFYYFSDGIRLARTRIGAFNVPKSVDFASALPKNATGKVLKRELRKPNWENRDRQVN